MRSTLAILIFSFLLIHCTIVLAVEQTEEEEDNTEISVIAVGDITIGSSFTSLIESRGADVFFEGTAPLIQSADVATVSLNTSISDRGEPRHTQEPYFRAALGLGRALANSGFDAVSLATPHITDFGMEALEDTLIQLERYNVKTMGAGVSAKAAQAPAWLDVKDKKVALLAYLRENEFGYSLSHHTVAPANYSQMIRAVKAVAAEAQLVIIWLHWGKRDSDSKVREGSIGRQRIFANALIDAGADLVLCQQLHTLGGIELYKGKPIIYSLADFIYDKYQLLHARVVIPKVTFIGGEFKSIELIPVLADVLGAPFPQPRLLKVGDSTNPAKTPEAGEISRKGSLEYTAIEALEDYQKRCAAFKTEVVIEGNRGWIHNTNSH